MKAVLLASAATVLVAAAPALAQTPAPQADGQTVAPAPQQSPTGGEAQTPTTAVPGTGDPTRDVGTPLDADVAEREDVIVTGSRVPRAGFQAPTPVTVASTEQLAAASPTTIGDALRQLPALTSSVGPRGAQTSGGQGGAFLNLRNLGPIRTLTLFDGKRFVPQQGTGLIDTNLFPQALVSRVEVVTGGASAAYGSDAVAGVVNFILDKKYTGVKAEAQVGISEYGDGSERRASLSGGTPFAGGRGHLLANIEYFKQEEISERLFREVAQRSCQIIPLPAGSATLRDYQCNVRAANANFNGLITGPAAFRGTTFNADGTPRPFQYGTLTTNAFTVGGEGVIPQFAPLSAGLERLVTFTRASFDVAPDHTLFAEVLLGRNDVTYQVGSFSNVVGNTALTIRRDNAFLDPSISSRLPATGTVTLGKYLAELPKSQVSTRDRTLRLVAGMDGNVAGITYGLYGEYGRNQRYLEIVDNLILPNYFRATDAIRNAAGQIVCRTEAGARPGCVPVNPFGTPQLTAAQRAYIVGTNINFTTSHQYTAALNLSAQPFSTWAGPVSLAGGAEYRKQDFSQTVDPGSTAPNFVTNGTGIYRVGNARPQSGEYNIREAYVEVVVPLAKDTPFLQSLELNAAGRVTDYSTSGRVETWKVGGTWEPFDGVRLRATRSRDIRAPVLTELFQAGITNFIPSVFDPIRNVQVNNARSITLGNLNLNPEIADTFTGGLVLSPGFIPGFNISVDYYDIKIDGAITTPSSGQVLEDCARGVQELCNRIFRDAAGNLLTIELVPLNLQQFRTSGVDIEASYRFPLVGGDLTLRGLANYVDRFQQAFIGQRSREFAGQSDTAPRWRAVAQANYERGPFALFLQMRYTGPGSFDLLTLPTDLRQIRIPDEAIVNGQIRYTIKRGDGGDATIFLNVQNLFNNLPPDLVPTAGQYDPIGRFFRLGLRANF